MEAGITPRPLSDEEMERMAASQGAIEKARQSKPMTVAEEESALDFLLGETRALEFTLKASIETPSGLKPLTVHFRQQDGSVLDRIDAENRTGEGPFAKLDVQGFNAGVFAAAVFALSDDRRTVQLDDPAFIGGHPMGKLGAVQARFKFEAGVVDSIVQRVREVSGWSPDRVGTPQRRLVEAGKDFSS